MRLTEVGHYITSREWGSQRWQTDRQTEVGERAGATLRVQWVPGWEKMGVGNRSVETGSYLNATSKRGEKQVWLGTRTPLCALLEKEAQRTNGAGPCLWKYLQGRDHETQRGFRGLQVSPHYASRDPGAKHFPLYSQQSCGGRIQPGCGGNNLH